MAEITWIQPYYDLILNEIPLDAKTVLDVGAGYGVFGSILKKSRDIITYAVEPFKEYDLSHYDQVINLTWNDFFENCFDEAKPFDVLVSTEMIEHLPKPHAINFLSQAKQAAKKVIIATPYHWEQQEAYDGNEYQRHNCVMTVKNFTDNGYTVRLLGIITKRGLTSRVYFHPRWLKFLEMIGLKTTNIIATKLNS